MQIKKQRSTLLKCRLSGCERRHGIMESFGIVVGVTWVITFLNDFQLFDDIVDKLGLFSINQALVPEGQIKS